jgi:hypothetical protein
VNNCLRSSAIPVWSLAASSSAHTPHAPTFGQRAAFAPGACAIPASPWSRDVDNIQSSRERLLRKLFAKRAARKKELDTIEKAILVIGREYWKAKGFLFGCSIQQLEKSLKEEK